MSKLDISIGIVTLKDRTDGLAKLLESLKPVVKSSEHHIEILVANNSGSEANPVIQQCIETTNLSSICPIQLIDSPQNNIATGRNLLLKHAKYDLLAFLDDDEHVVSDWLDHLLLVMEQNTATVVAGPVPAVFHSSAPAWVRTVDLHNIESKKNNQKISMTGTGNVLINRSQFRDLQFNEEFGITGGSDTDYFMRLQENGGTLFWASNAIAYEDIPEHRSSSKYLIHRFIKQGENYLKINAKNEQINSLMGFKAKALVVVGISLPIAFMLIIIRHKRSGHWMKRAFSNYGKLHSTHERLYEAGN